MNREFFQPVKDGAWKDWVYSSELCDVCWGLLVMNLDFPYCEEHGSHSAHACLQCGVWWDDVWPDEKFPIEDD